MRKINKKIINRIEDVTYNPILNADSYKFSHWKQYVNGTTRMKSYLESRAGEINYCTLFALQPLLHKYLSNKITKIDVLNAQKFAEKHGEPFNYDGWMHIVNKYEGKLPVVIRAIPEGTVVPVSNVVLTIECDDPDCFWVVSYLETMLMRLWYPSTIAILAREFKKVYKEYADKSSDSPDIDSMFGVIDFGSRGVSCYEQSQLGGAAMLTSFFGSDNVPGINFANHYYHCDMSASSIPASEHSVVSMHGRENEYDFFDKFIKMYLTDIDVPEGMPKMASSVSDTYNIYNAVRYYCKPEVRKTIRQAKGVLKIRPDSGDPLEVLKNILIIFKEELKNEIILNNKGYKVLPNELSIIQGDGIDLESMKEILRVVVDELGWSSSIINFGSGGGALQKVNRDTQKWAFKCCAAWINGKQVDVCKDPITDSGKQSKAGNLDLIYENGKYKTVSVPDGQEYSKNSVLDVVFAYGDIYTDTTFDEVRQRISL